MAVVGVACQARGSVSGMEHFQVTGSFRGYGGECKGVFMTTIPVEKGKNGVLEGKLLPCRPGFIRGIIDFNRNGMARCAISRAVLKVLQGEFDRIAQYIEENPRNWR